MSQLRTKEVIHVVSSISAEQADNLRTLINEFTGASINMSWAGGGDPLDIPLLEATLALAEAKLERFIANLVREQQ